MYWGTCEHGVITAFQLYFFRFSFYRTGQGLHCSLIPRWAFVIAVAMFPHMSCYGGARRSQAVHIPDPQAMTLMEYLIKTGSERVSQQCKENMYAVQTLKDFQYVDRDGKDQGVNVREKAKQLVALLRDEDRLREERAHALKTKEKLAQTATGEPLGSLCPSSLLPPSHGLPLSLLVAKPSCSPSAGQQGPELQNEAFPCLLPPAHLIGA